MREKWLYALLLTLGLSLSGSGAVAADEPGCLDCHNDPASTAHAVFDTVHRSLNGGGAAACTACHGASEEHDRRGMRAPPDVSFGPRWASAPEQRNNSCLGCHEAGDQLLWAGSAHEEENITCDNCHKAHRRADLALDHSAAERQCLSCHTAVRAQLQLPSRHPVAEGKTACSDCHNPHGGLGDSALREVTLNDNCLGCHQEFRGPFLWEHPPVAEDCALCHRPHGSVHPRLLTTRGPALCQQCHAAAFHPSIPVGAEGLPGASPNRNLLGKNCLNCHGRVHGSNHPSGARLTR
ncbi:MAG: DmsE family decaheme c-type cytochrome [Halioglobus sp.]|nr:DmsE family decaheme c-type cytochrome [Halioglobus sp.]